MHIFFIDIMHKSMCLLLVKKILRPNGFPGFSTIDNSPFFATLFFSNKITVLTPQRVPHLLLISSNRCFHLTECTKKKKNKKNDCRLLWLKGSNAPLTTVQREKFWPPAPLHLNHPHRRFRCESNTVVVSWPRMRVIWDDWLRVEHK